MTVEDLIKALEDLGAPLAEVVIMDDEHELYYSPETVVHGVDVRWDIDVAIVAIR